AGLAFALLLFAWAGGLVLCKRRAVRRDSTEMSHLALIARKTDHAALITSTEGTIEWVNDGFTRASGYSPDEAIGKPPGALLLGPLHNINIIQKIRETVIHQKTLSIEMLCSHK